MKMDESIRRLSTLVERAIWTDGVYGRYDNINKALLQDGDW